MAESKKRTKDPDATLDYTWDWGPWLGDDVIDSYDIIIPDAITLESQSSTDTTVTGWFSGGIDGEDYPAVCRITTASSPQLINDWTMTLKVREQ